MKKKWKYPPLSLLDSSASQEADRGDIKQTAIIIEDTLNKFGILAEVVEVNFGPQVTQYALKLDLGIHTSQNTTAKVSQKDSVSKENNKKQTVTSISEIIAHVNDLALALNPPFGKIWLEAPIPGRDLVGIEIPNKSPEFITLKGILKSDLMKNNKYKLIVPLGLDISGAPITLNIAAMPHILIAGTARSGRSMLINSWITTLIFNTTDQEVRLVFVDSKRRELSKYDSLPHRLSPAITDPAKVLSAFKWVIFEMERRYKMFAEVEVKNIGGYNKKFYPGVIPYIVIFISELAELMAYDPVEIGKNIYRIAEKGRVAGIHLVIATQHPSADVFTGRIKAYIPARISFNVSSKSDSQVIIDMPGAEKLLGNGDMVYILPDQARPSRAQGTYISEQEIYNIVNYIQDNNHTFPKYTEEKKT